MQIRGDGVWPPFVAVRARTAGKYRFTIELENAAAEADKIGVFRLLSDDGATVMTEATNGNKLVQSGVLKLKEGTWIIRIAANHWAAQPVVSEVTIDKVE